MRRTSMSKTTRRRRFESSRLSSLYLNELHRVLQTSTDLDVASTSKCPTDLDTSIAL